MLKIRDDIDLKELEKFGFKFYYANDKWLYVINYFDCWFVVCAKTRELELEIYHSDGLDYKDLNNILLVVFNLTQAGLVEKVEE